VSGPAHTASKVRYCPLMHTAAEDEEPSARADAESGWWYAPVMERPRTTEGQCQPERAVVLLPRRRAARRVGRVRAIPAVARRVNMRPLLKIVYNRAAVDE